MTKSLSSFGLVLVGTLFGCDLYFGNGSGGGGTGGGGGSGYACTSNTQCASGCYCSNGTCTEGGFCSTDADCGPGYHCDTMRSSCEPNPPAMTCNFDNQCPQGQYCNPASNTCTATCTCTNDQQAIAGGFGWCDTTRDTCLPGENPAGTCAGDVSATCTTAAPQCAVGSVPLLFGGCYNGNCQVYAQCNLPPVCTHINDESDCLGRTDCSASYNGIDCTKPDGSACKSGDTNCTCQSYVFATCGNKTP
jgi:hypothetical protein